MYFLPLNSKKTQLNTKLIALFVFFLFFYVCFCICLFLFFSFVLCYFILFYYFFLCLCVVLFYCILLFLSMSLRCAILFYFIIFVYRKNTKKDWKSGVRIFKQPSTNVTSLRTKAKTPGPPPENCISEGRNIHLNFGIL